MEDSKVHSQGLFSDIDNHIRSIQSESLAGFSAFLGEVSDPALSEAARVEKLANYYEGLNSTNKCNATSCGASPL